MNKYPIVKDQKTVYEGFLKIRKETLLFDHDYTHQYETLIAPNHAVVILGITKDQEVLINEEYRHPVGKYLIGLPGGYLDGDEDPISGGKREFLEETGYQAKRWKTIGKSYPYPGISNQQIDYILAEEIYYTQEPQLEPSEKLRSRLLPIQALQETLKSGSNLDGTLCTAWCFYVLFEMN